MDYLDVKSLGRLRRGWGECVGFLYEEWIAVCMPYHNPMSVRVVRI